MILRCNIMEECIICFDETEELDFVVFPCNHKTCVKCYPLILNERPHCPMCNASLIPDHVSLNIEQNSFRIQQQRNIINRIYIEKGKCILIFLFVCILFIYIHSIYYKS
jgi:hypothetical protein